MRSTTVKFSIKIFASGKKLSSKTERLHSINSSKNNIINEESFCYSVFKVSSCYILIKISCTSILLLKLRGEVNRDKALLENK